MEAAARNVVDAERQAVLERLDQALGRPDGLAVGGLEPVLEALRAQQVDTLFLDGGVTRDGELWVGEVASQVATDAERLRGLGSEPVGQLPVDVALLTAAAASGAAFEPLGGGRTGLVALVVPEVDSPYWSEIAALVAAAAEERGWTLLVDATGGDPARERRLLSGARAQVVDGIILSPWSLGAEDLRGPGRDDGAPPVPPITCQNIVWLAWPPALLRIAVRTASGASPTRVSNSCSGSAASAGASRSAAFRAVT